MKYLVYILSFTCISYIYSCVSCCKKAQRMRYYDVTEAMTSAFNDIKRCKYSEVIKSLKELKNQKKSTKIGDFEICYIDIDRLNSVDGVDVDICELKRQVKFLEYISSIYIIEFLFRLLTVKNDLNLSFMLSVNGVGGAFSDMAGYVNLDFTEALCKKNECETVLNYRDIEARPLPSGVKYVFTEIPIYDRVADRFYSSDVNTFKLLRSWVYSDVKETNSKLMYFYSICEKLAQIGNPLFAVCNGSEYDISSIYNSLLLLSDDFGGFDFFKRIGDDFIKNYEKRKNGEFLKLSSDELFAKLSELGAVKEEKIVMLAEVIVLNNLLYYVYKFAGLRGNEVITSLAFSSYGGRVFEMFMSLLKNKYSNVVSGVSSENSVSVKRGDINVIFIHALLGANKLKSCSDGIISFNREKIFKDLGNSIISSDRLKYFDCDNIFGNSFESLIEYYHNFVNESRINQIISNFTENKQNSFLKNIVRWNFKDIFTSFYESKYNDGVLSQDGLFVYNNVLNRDNVSSIISGNSGAQSSRFYGISGGRIKSENYKYSTSVGSGSFIIEDNFIRYINVGGGAHFSVEEDTNSYSIYDNRGKELEDLISECV